MRWGRQLGGVGLARLLLAGQWGEAGPSERSSTIGCLWGGGGPMVARWELLLMSALGVAAVVAVARAGAPGRGDGNGGAW